MAKVTIEPKPQGGRMYPKNSEEHDKLLNWCLQAFRAADDAREPHFRRWERFYQLYRSWRAPRRKGDWHSRVFIPIVFWVIETITPRLVAELPKFVVKPVGPEDVEPAERMEGLLAWAVSAAPEEHELYYELVNAIKQSLMFGTGILKTRYITVEAVGHRAVPVMEDVKRTVDEPVLDEHGLPMSDIDGAPMIQTREIFDGQVRTGTRIEPYVYESFDGPVAEWVDIWDFWAAPEASDVQKARYVIHRSWMTQREVKQLVSDGTYKLPDDFEIKDSYNTSDESLQKRLGLVGEDGGAPDPTRKAVEVMEFWTDDGRVITMLNRSVIARASEVPYSHGQKPFARIVDQLDPGNFWGIGEIEPLEGLQDFRNALSNSIIDNLKIILNQMFAVNENEIADLAELRFRPGGIIRTKGQALPEEAIMPVQTGNIPTDAYNQIQQTDSEIERISGVSSYQLGVDTPSQNDTATGVNTMYEAGATRFGLKNRLAELMGLKTIARQWGSMLQQFTTQEKMIRITGPEGGMDWDTFSPEDLAGSLDYDIESESLLQTESMRRQQSLTLLQALANYAEPDPLTGGPGKAVASLVEDVLKAFQKKDLSRYTYSEQEKQAAQMQLQQQQMIEQMVAAGMDPAQAQMQAAGIGDPGGRQEYGMPQPPGALGLNQSAEFGPRGGGESADRVFRAIAAQAAQPAISGAQQ